MSFKGEAGVTGVGAQVLSWTYIRKNRFRERMTSAWNTDLEVCKDTERPLLLHFYLKRESEEWSPLFVSQAYRKKVQ